MTQDKAVAILKAAYIAEVKSRCMEFVDDAKTNEAISKVAAILTKPEPKIGIMFCGTCGNGKTTMLNAIKLATSQLKEWGLLNTNDKPYIRVVDAREMAEICKDEDTFKSVRSENMLAIEDMGKESAEVMNYGNVQNPLMYLIESRYAKQKYTIITTNLTAQQIKEKYGNRITDRFNEMLDVVVFGDGTYRR